MKELLEDRRLLRLIAVITLDRAAAFWDAIGVQGAEPRHGLITPMRAWLQQNLERQTIQGAENRPQTGLLARIQAAHGFPAAERTQRWVAHTAHPDSMERTWQVVLTRAARTPPDWALLGLPRELESEAVEATASDSKQAEAYSHAELSDWDLGIWALLKFDEDENDPVNDLQLLSSRWKFMGLWRRLGNAVNDRENFVHAANSIARGLGFKTPLQWVGTEDWPQ
jgi:hypothetical protein